MDPLILGGNITPNEAEEINLEDFLIDPNLEIPEPIPILSISQDGIHIPIFTEQNISMIFGPQKSRKSTLIKSICQALMVGKNEKMVSNYQRNEIAIVDTEQDRYRCYKTTVILNYLTGKNVTYFSAVGTGKDVKKKIVEQHLESNPNCGFLILDNIVHFLKNFNDVEESADLTEWLLRIKQEYNVHILVILHENASGDKVKPRGHLGTNLLNICETIIKIEKDSQNKMQSIVSAFDTRGLDFREFCVTQDYQGTPYLSEYIETKKKKI